MSVEKPKAASGKKYTPAVADPRGREGRTPQPLPSPPGGQILSISCSFGEILAKSYVGALTSGKSWIRHWPVDLCGNCYHH